MTPIIHTISGLAYKEISKMLGELYAGNEAHLQELFKTDDFGHVYIDAGLLGFRVADTAKERYVAYTGSCFELDVPVDIGMQDVRDKNARILELEESMGIGTVEVSDLPWSEEIVMRLRGQGFWRVHQLHDVQFRFSYARETKGIRSASHAIQVEYDLVVGLIDDVYKRHFEERYAREGG